jgi:hypothetical protein
MFVALKVRDLKTPPRGEAVGERSEGDRAEGGTDEVQLLRRARVRGLRHMSHRDKNHDQREREVDEEHQAPGGDLDEPAAKERPDGAGQTGKPRPGADRTHPVLGGERRLQDRQRPGRQQGGADSLQGPGRDQEADARGEPAQQRRQREPRHADDEDPAPAEAVAKRSAEQDERGERQRIGVDRPLQRGGARVELLADAREGDVDDGAVDEGQSRPQNRREQDPAPGRLAVAQAARHQSDGRSVSGKQTMNRVSPGSDSTVSSPPCRATTMR